MDPEDQQGAHDSQAEAGARLGSAVERERAGQGIRHQPGCLGEVATSFHEGLGTGGGTWCCRDQFLQMNLLLTFADSE